MSGGQKCNFFKELELNLDATAIDVRDAYKRLAKQWHPDKNKDDGAEEKFKQVLAAYTHLQSDDRRETHARELKRQQEATTAPKPQPPPQPPPQTSPKPPTYPPSSKSSRSQSTKHSNSGHPTTKPKTRPSTAKQSTSGSKNDHQNWWDSFKAKNGNSTTKESRPSSNKANARPSPSSAKLYTWMNSFMDLEDPFDDILFDIFMIPANRPAPKSKPKTDHFGNKLPRNLDSDIYDWKTATKSTGQQPDYQEYLDSKLYRCHV